MLETIENLTKAFIGESQARNRYTMFAQVARKEGLHQAADIFMETAENELQHAKWFFRMLQDIRKKGKEEVHDIIVDASADIRLGDTKENLMSAIAGEHEETSGLYPEFAKIAEDEGFPDIASRIRAIANSEAHHEKRFSAILEEIENGTLLKKPDKKVWVCSECGYVHQGSEPPEKCPSCSHPKEYFRIKCERY